MKSPLLTHASSAVLLAMTVFCAGCSESPKDAKVSGQVTLDGNPLSSAVILLEDRASGAGGTAVIENGSFSFPTSLPTGKYAVALQPPPPPAPHESSPTPIQTKLPRHLTRPETSGLEAELTPGENALDFKVDSK